MNARTRGAAQRAACKELYLLHALGLTVRCEWCNGTGRAHLLRPAQHNEGGTEAAMGGKGLRWRAMSSAQKRRCIECHGAGVVERDHA